MRGTMEHLQRRDLTGGRKWCPKEVKRLWEETAQPCTSHPYLEKMGIGDPGGVRVIGKTLVIPMRTMRQPFVNLQLIDPDNRIAYLPGAEVSGTLELPRYDGHLSIWANQGGVPWREEDEGGIRSSTRSRSSSL